jgi:ABC-type multidrug transport system fused ATPase/permease subunit
LTFAAIKQSLQRVLEQARRYFTNFAWLIRESLRVAPRQWWRIVVATAFSLGSNAAVMGTIYLYVRLLESNHILEFWDIRLVPRESLLLLGGFVAALLVALIVHAISHYIARRASLRIHRLYQVEARRQALHLIRHLPDPRAARLSLLFAGNALRRVYAEYPRSCGWAMRMIGNAAPSMALFVGAYGALLWLDPETTLLLTLMGLAVVAAQYPAHLFAATASNVADENRVIFSNRLSALADAVDRSAAGPAGEAVDEQIERFHDDPQVMRYEDATENRFRSMEVSTLAMQTGGALVFVAVLFIIASDLIAQRGNWAVLVVYATLLRQLLSSTTGVIRAVTVFSRMSPHVNAYRTFVSIARRALEPPGDIEPAPGRLILAGRELEGPAATVSIAPGERFLLLSRGTVGRGLALALQRAAVLGRLPSPSDGTAVESTDGTPGLPRIRVAAANAGHTSSGQPNLVPALESAVAEGVDLLLIAAADFAELGPDQEAYWLCRLRNCRIGLVDSAAPADADAGALILMRDRSDTFSWCRVPEGGLTKELRLTIRQLLLAGERASRAVAAVDEEAD